MRPYSGTIVPCPLDLLYLRNRVKHPELKAEIFYCKVECPVAGTTSCNHVMDDLEIIKPNKIGYHV